MDTIDIPIDQPDASFGCIGDRYYGIYRRPHGKWRQLLGKNKERLYFDSAQEATRAAMAEVNRQLFGKIRADRMPDEKQVAKVLDVEGWRKSRANTALQERETLFRGLGKRSIEVRKARIG
ncbi:hypothetical protein [Consotaella aegiceratis]|uniref:hypothetical protein n=1 Tax=Consotaella aegiceratis TaxID=3097961 RepID=UPI002F3F61AA